MPKGGVDVAEIKPMLYAKFPWSYRIWRVIGIGCALDTKLGVLVEVETVGGQWWKVCSGALTVGTRADWLRNRPKDWHRYGGEEMPHV